MMRAEIKNVVLLAALFMMGLSCQKFSGEGEIELGFSVIGYQSCKAAVRNLPDTNDFRLRISTSAGTEIYNGEYGRAPQVLEVKAGSYTIEVESCDFVAPKFDSPQFGDTQVIVVKSGETVRPRLQCMQMNCGIRISVASSFLTAYPDAVLWLSNDDGRLMYSVSEKRYAYFRPGNVSLVMDNSGKTSVLFSRSMDAAQMLSVSLSSSSPSSGSSSSGEDSRTGIALGIQIDTTRTWLSDNIDMGSSGTTPGGQADGSNIKTALSVSQALEHIGDKDVWVYGYIVAGDLTSANADFDGPFTSRTNFAIASKATVDDKEKCMSVALPSGEIRDELNLVDNPDNLHRKIYLKGDIVEAYYGIPGIKNVDDYSF